MASNGPVDDITEETHSDEETKVNCQAELVQKALNEALAAVDLQLPGDDVEAENSVQKKETKKDAPLSSNEEVSETYV